MKGVIVNSITVFLGSIIGILINKGIKESLKESIMNGLGLCIILIGISVSVNVDNIILVIVSIVVGTIIGEEINIDRKLHSLGNRMEEKLKGKGGGKISEGFVLSTLLMCVGAMSVVGSLEAGLSSNNSTLYAKSVLDGFSAIIFSSTYGIGVAFSAISIFIYQGFIASLAFLIKDILTPEAINNMSIVGGLLISALGLNMLKITKIKVANLLPAILIPFIYEIFKNMIKLIGV
ncbi:DUF554 domain-containing protein [Clostridium tetani]|nr:DUF554 domain-containing protein [Clostridium tetani]CDI50689.1 transporter [Clostridium tetani 12124569]KHO32210.1 membrane protein [Clostridium tetani]RXI39729.1 DUF554 domain-containing protein [Clostridium tetani]RXI57794.1 DUF554 domain-containing protein [Clostridium tetani]RXI67722.1 DUF554 domain-containing protein [Clostridium tetani]